MKIREAQTAIDYHCAGGHTFTKVASRHVSMVRTLAIPICPHCGSTTARMAGYYECAWKQPLPPSERLGYGGF